jgi:hypothetical protein
MASRRALFSSSGQQESEDQVVLVVRRQYLYPLNMGVSIARDEEAAD